MRRGPPRVELLLLLEGCSQPKAALQRGRQGEQIPHSLPFPLLHHRLLPPIDQCNQRLEDRKSIDAGQTPRAGSWSRNVKNGPGGAPTALCA